MNAEQTFLAISTAFTFLVFGVTPVYADEITPESERVTAAESVSLDAEQTAQAAAVADGVSTVAAISMGAVETNHVVIGAGLLPITALKLALPRLVRDAEPETRKAVLTTSTGVWSAATANNLLVIAGATGPFAIVGGIAVGVYMYFSAVEKFEAEAAPVEAVALVKEN